MYAIVILVFGDLTTYINAASNFWNKYKDYFVLLGKKLQSLSTTSQEYMSKITTSIMSGSDISSFSNEMISLGIELGLCTDVPQKPNSRGKYNDVYNPGGVVSPVNFSQGQFGIQLTGGFARGIGSKAFMAPLLNCAPDNHGNLIGGTNFGVSVGVGFETALDLGVVYMPYMLNAAGWNYVVVNVDIQPPVIPISLSVQWYIYDFVSGQNIFQNISNAEPQYWSLSVNLLTLGTEISTEKVDMTPQFSANIGYDGYIRSENPIKMCAHTTYATTESSICCYDSEIKRCHCCPLEQIYSTGQGKCISGRTDNIRCVN